MKYKKSYLSVFLWIFIILIGSNIGILDYVFSGSSSGEVQTVTEDLYMKTELYNVKVVVGSDQTYEISEEIQVDFSTARHGIYRYIPVKGNIEEIQEDGVLREYPYFAKINDIESNTTVKTESENGNRVLRMGDEDAMVTGKQTYSFSYKYIPVTEKGYSNIYLNIYPVGWQNEIPEGSSFRIQFPENFDHSSVKLYYGGFGEQKDAMDLLSVSWDGNSLNGSLRKSLELGDGLTLYVPMDAGYFKDVHTVWPYNLMIIIVSAVVILVLLILFFLFGREESIVPSIQFHPPSGLDSAAVGYIVDGNVSDADVISLLLYWADAGYLKIKELPGGSLSLIQEKKLPEDTPAYARTFFEGIFGGGDENLGREIKVSSLRYKAAEKVQSSKELLHSHYQNIYTWTSKLARAAALILSPVPLAVYLACLLYLTNAGVFLLLLWAAYTVGLVLFCRTVDFWYSKNKTARKLGGSTGCALCLGSILVLLGNGFYQMTSGKILSLFPGLVAAGMVSAFAVVLTGFMKKRTGQCREWMGYLAGLRDFIETAELERMEVIAKDSPHLFYHILPFAYVFGLSDLLLDKMKDLAVPAPQWYVPVQESPYFNYMMMRHLMGSGMREFTACLVVPPPQKSSGGGISHGGFSGGGFSGGGFGGGGGGSW